MKNLISSVVALLCATVLSAQTYDSRRPSAEERLFVSDVVEQTILKVTSQLTNPKLAWMFANCFPNTLDTTVHYDKDGNEVDMKEAIDIK